MHILFDVAVIVGWTIAVYVAAHFLLRASPRNGHAYLYKRQR